MRAMDMSWPAVRRKEIGETQFFPLTAENDEENIACLVFMTFDETSKLSNFKKATI